MGHFQLMITHANAQRLKKMKKQKQYKEHKPVRNSNFQILVVFEITIS